MTQTATGTTGIVFLPTAADDEERNAAAQRWISALGIDPTRVPAGSVAKIWVDDTVTVQNFAFDEYGAEVRCRCQCGIDGGTHRRIKTVTAPMGENRPEKFGLTVLLFSD